MGCSSNWVGGGGRRGGPKLGVFLEPGGAGSSSTGGTGLRGCDVQTGGPPGRSVQEQSFSLACWLVGSGEGRLLAGEGQGKSRFLSVSGPRVQCGGLLWPPVPPPSLLPPPGPSAARRRPPAVPRTLYQIINKAAGAVRVNILAGLAGHCRGGCPLWLPRSHRGPATPAPAPAGLWGSPAPSSLGWVQPLPRCVRGGRGTPGPAASQPQGVPGLSGLLSSLRSGGPRGGWEWGAWSSSC